MPTIPVNGVNLFYEMRGRGQPLLFLHGLGSSTREWEDQIDEFSKNYQVIAYDLRGHGRSDKPAGPYTMELYAADTAGLLDALKVQSAHVVGLSLGGAVAFQLALDHPERVKSLVIVNSGPSMGGSPEQANREIEQRIGIVRQMGMRAMGQALSPRLFPKDEHAPLRQTFEERWAANDPDAYIQALLAMQGWDVTSRLGQIRCPTLILSADQDYTPVAAKEAYVSLMPNAQLVVIPDSHHGVPIEAPDKFNAAVSQFLARQH